MQSALMMDQLNMSRNSNSGAGKLFNAVYWMPREVIASLCFRYLISVSFKCIYELSYFAYCWSSIRWGKNISVSIQCSFVYDYYFAIVIFPTCISWQSFLIHRPLWLIKILSKVMTISVFGLQLKLLTNGFRLLKAGGILVYSTCRCLL